MSEMKVYSNGSWINKTDIKAYKDGAWSSKQGYVYWNNSWSLFTAPMYVQVSTLSLGTGKVVWVDETYNYYYTSYTGYVEKRNLLNGALVWKYTFSNSSNTVRQLEVDSSQNVYISTLAFGAGIIKLNSSGSYIRSIHTNEWIRGFKVSYTGSTRYIALFTDNGASSDVKFFTYDEHGNVNLTVTDSSRLSPLGLTGSFTIQNAVVRYSPLIVYGNSYKLSQFNSGTVQGQYTANYSGIYPIKSRSFNGETFIYVPDMFERMQKIKVNGSSLVLESSGWAEVNNGTKLIDSTIDDRNNIHFYQLYQTGAKYALSKHDYITGNMVGFTEIARGTSKPERIWRSTHSTYGDSLFVLWKDSNNNYEFVIYNKI